MLKFWYLFSKKLSLEKSPAKEETALFHSSSSKTFSSSPSKIFFPQQSLQHLQQLHPSPKFQEISAIKNETNITFVFKIFSINLISC